MSERTVPKLPKWPFFLGDILLVTLAYLILGAAYAHGKWPMNTWQNLWCVLSLSLGCVLGVLPFLLEYRAAMKLTEADRLTNAVLQIENLEIIGRQIGNATAGWQTAPQHADNAGEAARAIADGITKEARATSEFLLRANDSGKDQLRLEVDRHRRAEDEPEFIVGPAAEIPQSPAEPAVSEQEWVQKEPPEEEQDEFRT